MALLLVLTVLLPMAGSVALFAMPQLPTKTARTIGLGVTLVTFGLSMVLVYAFQTDLAGPQFAFSGTDGKLGLSWLPQYGVRFALGIDGISLWMFALTSLLMITAVFSSWESVTTRAPAHYALLLALQTGLLGLFASLDVVLFYIFFEFTLIPLFFLIGIYGGPERRRASVTFFLYTLAGSLLTLIGVIALVVVNYQHSVDHTLTFSIPELTAKLAALPWPEWQSLHTWGDWREGKAFWGTPQVLIFLLLFAGFAIKVPLFPFHTWLPLAHVEAPTAGSILLAGVMLKVGSYGFIRFNMAMTPLGAQALAPMMATLAVVGILYGALAALAQSDVKRLVAYSSVSHMGFILLGLFALNATGIEGAVIQMLNHGLTTGALFACVGVIYERYHTRDMGELGGLWKRLPLWAFFIILASLGSAALPGLNGFVGEFPILAGMYKSRPIYAIFAALGMILGAYYLLLMLQKVVFGPLHEPSAHLGHGHDGHDSSAHHEVRPVAWHEIAGLTPLMILIVLIGISPGPFLDRIKPPLVTIVENLTKPRTPIVANAPVISTPEIAGPQPVIAKADVPATAVRAPGKGQR
ncbi:complex I subunit 4 family protein [Tundrisphaera lichenicola]|uniref:complex I subunit 4 family protein n=1 Tax=Tundrisphaera lichenicola TaxID=2029860 RepID=UPI003EB8827A